MRLVYWTIFPNGHQRAWIDGLRRAGCDVEVCYFGVYDAYRKALGWVEPELPAQEHRVASLAEALRVIPDYASRTIVLTGYVDRVYHENVRYCEQNGIPWRLLIEGTRDRLRTLPFRRAFGRRVNRSAEWAFGIGVDATQELIHRWGIAPEKVAEVSYVTPEVPIPSPVAHEGFRFVYAGSYVVRKAIDILAAAWARHAPSHPQDRLRVIGPEPLPDALQALPHVEFTGPVPPEHLPEHLTDCDCGILVSRQDGWGMVLAEFARSGLRLIGSDHCGASETLIQPGRNGVIVPAGDVVALTQAMAEAPTWTPDPSRLATTFAGACVERFLNPQPFVKPEHHVVLAPGAAFQALTLAKQGQRVTLVQVGAPQDSAEIRACRTAGVTVVFLSGRAFLREFPAMVRRATRLYLPERRSLCARWATHLAKKTGVPVAGTP